MGGVEGGVSIPVMKERVCVSVCVVKGSAEVGGGVFFFL